MFKIIRPELVFVVGLCLSLLGSMSGCQKTDKTNCECPTVSCEAGAQPDASSNSKPELSIPPEPVQGREPPHSSEPAQSEERPDAAVREIRVSVEKQPDLPPVSITCTGPTRTFYSQPTRPPRRIGDVVRCELINERTADAVSADGRFIGLRGQKAPFGFKLYRIMYTTRYRANELRYSTALLYVPNQVGVCKKDAMISVVGHGTTGIAKQCGPSTFPDFALNYLTFPLVARGRIVVAPDYIGLGLGIKEGHPYLQRKPTVYAMLDAVRAVTFLTEHVSSLKGCSQKRVLLLGHSQGGHAALIAANAFSRELSEYSLAGTIAFAPAFGDGNVWLGPLRADWKTLESTAYFVSYLLSVARYNKGPALQTWLTPKARAWLPGTLDTFCFAEWKALFLHQFPTLRDLFTPSFLAAYTACKAGKGDCTAFKPWLDAVRDSVIQGDKITGPVLLVQGGGDRVVSLRSVSCLAKRLKSKNIDLHSCHAPLSNHSTILSMAWPALLPWIEAALHGTALPKLNGARCPSQSWKPCQ